MMNLKQNMVTSDIALGIGVNVLPESGDSFQEKQPFELLCRFIVL